MRIHNFLKRTRKNNAGDSQEEVKDKQLLRKRVNSLIRRKRIIDALKVVKSEGIKPWGRATQAKVCGLLSGIDNILQNVIFIGGLTLIFSLEAVCWNY